jgi:hypothetical protein
MFWTALFLLAFVFVLTYDPQSRTLERIVDPKLVESSENRKPIPYDENVTNVRRSVSPESKEPHYDALQFGRDAGYTVPSNKGVHMGAIIGT